MKPFYANDQKIKPSIITTNAKTCLYCKIIPENLEKIEYAYYENTSIPYKIYYKYCNSCNITYYSK